MSKNVITKVEFRQRQDQQKLPNIYSSMKLRAFKFVWMLGFKACLDFIIVELRGVEEHKAADTLELMKKETWHS